VKDNGIGMEKSFMDTIWEPFVREDKSRVHKTQGSGLGMAITKYIVDKMEGKIHVESQVGKGSVFNVEIDMKKAPNTDSDEMHFENKGTVLVVDDDRELGESAAELLSEFGLDAETTLDGESAVDMAMEKHRKGECYSLILMDWLLPGMDGIETVNQMRKQIGPDVPIILITAYDWIDFEDEARKAGITGFISKPLFKSTLFNGIKLYIEKAGAEKIEETTDEKHKSLHLLLAEDNELNKEVAEELLLDNGITIDWAENGSIAVEKFGAAPEGHYDAILMDIRMPVMDGYEAARQIREMQENRKDASLPIIAMTADAFSEDVRKCLDAGMNAHVSKPIDIKKLMQQLEEHLKSN